MKNLLVKIKTGKWLINFHKNELNLLTLLNKRYTYENIKQEAKQSYPPPNPILDFWIVHRKSGTLYMCTCVYMCACTRTCMCIYVNMYIRGYVYTCSLYLK